MGQPSRRVVDAAPRRTALEEEFFKQIELSPALPESTPAVDAILAVLGGILARLPRREGDDLAAALPPELHPILIPLVSADEQGQPRVELEPYLDEIGRRTRLGREGSGRLALAVLAATATLLGEDQLDQLEEKLPKELKGWRHERR